MNKFLLFIILCLLIYSGLFFPIVKFLLISLITIFILIFVFNLLKTEITPEKFDKYFFLWFLGILLFPIWLPLFLLLKLFQIFDCLFSDGIDKTIIQIKTKEFWLSFY